VIPFDDQGFLQDPYPILNAVREKTPIFSQLKPRSAQATWFLTRHDDIQSALRDRRLGRVFDHVLTYDQVGVEPPPPSLQPYLDIERWSLLQLEPPDHTRIRALLSREFTPRRVASLQPRMDQIASDLFDQHDSTDFELLSDLAAPLSLLIMCELLGAPFEDRHLLLDWSHRIVKMYEFEIDSEAVRSAVEASEEFSAWTSDLIARRRSDPQDDLISGLATVRTPDGQLSDPEIISTIILLLNAGHEATVNTIGNGFAALLTHPDEWRRLCAGDVTCAVAVEELFRYDSPLQLFERWVLVEDFQISGRHIPIGTNIAMLFGSANRDPRKWEQPDTFDIGRGNPTHVTFGWGLHHCIGAPLARMEVATALKHLATRFPGTELLAEPVRHPTFVIHGYEAVDVALG